MRPFHICIFLNGCFEEWNFSLSVFDKEFTHCNLNQDEKRIDLLIFVDGGTKYFFKNEKKIHSVKTLWVGDEDSLETDCKNKVQNIAHEWVKLSPNKDFSDFAKALDVLKERFFDQNLFLEIYGGLGYRRSHEMANIQEVKQFIETRPGKTLCLFHKGLMITNTKIEYHGKEREHLTIFAQKPLQITGCLYSGFFTLERPSHGLSNKISSSPAIINPEEGVVTIYIEENLNELMKDKPYEQ